MRRMLLALSLLLLAGFVSPLVARADTSQITIYKARQEIAAGNMNGAVSTMENYVALHPGQLDALRFLGDLYYREGNLLRAEVAYREALDINGYDRETHNRLGAVYASENRIDDAISEYERSLPGISSVDNLVALHQRKGDLQDYRLRIEQAYNLTQSDADLETELAQIEAALYDFSEAIAHYRHSLILDPYSIPTVNGLGLALLATNNPSDAQLQFRACLKQDPEQYACMNNLAVSYMDMHNDSRAESVLHYAYELAPEQPEAIINMGYIADDRGDWKRAIQFYAQAIAVWPYARDAYFNLAVTYDQHQLYPLAQAALLKGLAVSPNDAWMHYLLGWTYQLQGNHQLAIAQYRRAENSIDPSLQSLVQSALAKS